MNKNLKKKRKKGFTLIELVIVLAVLAIIALIAIPNFTKVRNDSLLKADKQSVEQIEKITLMAIANEDIKVATGSFSIKGAKVSSATAGLMDATQQASYESLIKDVKNPQENKKTSYTVEIYSNGDVTATTTP